MQWTVRTNSPCENTYIREDANEYSNNSPSGHSCYPDRCTDRFIFLRKKAQKKQEEQQAQIEATKQTVSMLVIDKKRMPLKESGLPQMVIEQTPKLMRRSKLPIVKAKIGPKIAIMIADEKVFDLIPLKKEIKAEVSGLYIVGVKGIRGSLQTPAPKKKVSLQNSRKTKLPDKCSQTYKLKVSESCHPYTQITDLFLFESDRYLQRSRELTRSDQIVKFLQSFGCALIAR